jgi:hypothetical protein
VVVVVVVVVSKVLVARRRGSNHTGIIVAVRGPPIGASRFKKFAFRHHHHHLNYQSHFSLFVAVRSNAFKIITTIIASIGNLAFLWLR